MEKIKHFIVSEKGKDILIVAIVILVGLGSFELGRLSNESRTSGIKIQYPAQGTSQGGNVVSALEAIDNLPQSISVENAQISPIFQNSSSVGKTFFASNRGTKYYPLGCSAGKSLKQENRIYFSTREEAERAGYQLSSACK
jgi:hypothetical protein